MVVYFVKSYCNKFIKIGTTNNLSRRLEELQTANPRPLKLLGFLNGGYDTEATLHMLFSKHRVSGEWFRNVGDLKRAQKILTNPEENKHVTDVRSLQKAILNLGAREKANRQKSGKLKARLTNIRSK